MAITVNTFASESYRTDVGQTDTNEVIYKLNPAQTYVMDCYVTSAGTASMKIMTDTTQPSDFTAFSVANDGTQSSNFTREIYGCSYVGLDIATGTWTTKVRRVS
jgi:hypothetical protein